MCLEWSRKVGRRILPKELDRELGLIFWGIIALFILWPFVILWLIFKIMAFIVSRWCFSCYKPFSISRESSVLLKSYWEKACLDGSPNLRYKHNTKYEEYKEVYICNSCGDRKEKIKVTKESY